MQFTWLPDKRRYVGTQTEAKALKLPFEVRDIPTSKDELMKELNAIEERHEQELQALRDELGGAVREPVEQTDGIEDAVDSVSTPDAAPSPAPAVAKTTVIDRTEDSSEPMDLSDQIGNLPKEKLLPVLSSALARLHEIAGFSGWSAFTKDVYSWSPAALAVERRMGMLMMAFFKNMDGGPAKPEARRAIVADATSSAADS